MRSGHSLRPHSRFNMVGNTIVDIPGNPNAYSFNSNDSAWLAGNLRESGDSVAAFSSDHRSSFLKGPHRVMPVTSTDPRELEALLTPIAGAFLPSRDSTDMHFLKTFEARKSKLPHLKGGVWKPYGNENDNMALYEMWEDGDFPPPAAGAAPAPDTDRDGMPDAWETAHGLDPRNASDGPADSDNDGYTNLEEFLNRTDPRTFVDYTKPANNRHSLHP